MTEGLNSKKCCSWLNNNFSDTFYFNPVVTIASWPEGEAAVKKYMYDNGLTFPAMLDDSGQFARSFGLKGVPASFILSPNGEIAFVETGYTTEAGLRLRLWLSALID